MSKKELPLVSVIMSVKNGEDHIQESIKSILDQTFTDFEFIIINDGSTDGTKQILNYFHRQDTRIRIIENQTNIGLPKSLNKAINASLGEYIARQDADDLSHAQRLEKEVKILNEKSNISLVGTWANVITLEGEEIDFIKCRNNQSSIENTLNNRGTLFPHGSVMMRKSVLHSLGLYNDRFLYSQDRELWLRFFTEGTGIFIIEELLYSFRLSPKTRKKKYLQDIYSNAAKELYISNDKEEYYSLLDKVETYIPNKAPSKEFSYCYDIIIRSLSNNKITISKKYFDRISHQLDIKKKIILYLLIRSPYRLVKLIFDLKKIILHLPK